MTKTAKKKRKPRLVRRRLIEFDLAEAIGTGDCNISGSAADLIRDGYDFPRRWVHNSEARPDDRSKAFLIGRGYSATIEKRAQIEAAHIPVMAINNFPKDGPKPDYWCTGDPSKYFGERIWTDESIIKFSPFDFRATERARDDAFAPLLTAMDAPSTHFFHHRNNETEFESWLHMPWISWGTSIYGPRVPKQFYEHGAGRSSMLIGIRLLWHLGFREVYLLGCDCIPHSHPAPEYWNTIFHLLAQIRPTLERFGMKVYQTNHNSHLRCLEFATFDEAIKTRAVA